VDVPVRTGELLDGNNGDCGKNDSTATGGSAGTAVKYRDFLRSKHVRHHKSGFNVDLEDINARAFDWQRVIVQWSLRTGRALLSEDCGLGKTLQQLLYAEHVIRRTHGKALLLCPLAVQRQTAREAEKFSIGCRVTICETQDDVQEDGISITNYEKLHHFNPAEFCCVVLDECQILKSYNGVTKRALCRSFAETPFRLGCSATPAPNDRMEIGNQSEFLGVLPSSEMLQRWFINAGDEVGAYRLRMHGQEDFWKWMSSWAVCISTPADIGFDSTGYVLPPLKIVEHVVENPLEAGMLFNVGKKISATNIHREKRAALHDRADVVAGLVNADGDMWAVWCDTDYEADALRERIPDAIEVRGSMPTKKKEQLLEAFTDGSERVIITKPEIGGLGLNWQHSHKTTWFAGYSFEKFYQCIRRLLRFGQSHPVECHIVRTENEASIMETVREKERVHGEMQSEVAKLMAGNMREELGLTRRELRTSAGDIKIQLPSWMKTKG